MAQLKDTIITGDASITGTLYPAKIQGNILLVPTTSNGITYGAGTAGQVLTTNGTSVYWAAVDALPAQSASTNGRYLVSNGDNGAAWADSISGDLLDIDTTPTSQSPSLITSGGVYDMIISQQTKYYGVCSTSASTQTKTVTIDGITALTTGLEIRVKMTNAQTYSGTPKLNVNSLGAKNIMQHGSTAAVRYQWQAGEIVSLTYDGTYWVLENNSLADTTYFGLTRLSSATDSILEDCAATPKAVKIAYDLAAEAVSSFEKGEASGVATLDSYSKVTATQTTARQIDITQNTTLNSLHNGCRLRVTGAYTITVPTSLPAGFECEIVHYFIPTDDQAPTVVTIACASNDVKLNGSSISITANEKYKVEVLAALTSTDWMAKGDFQ